MTIKTLEVIHRLLIEEKAKAKRGYDSARTLPCKNKESETVSKSVMERWKECAKACTAAENALEDFESYDW